MNKKELIQKIKAAARRDAKNRTDPRYLETMGFLVAKGFLTTNQEIALFPNKRIAIVDAIWAGKHAEPRILEVLPAAILRLPRHFDLDAEAHADLFETVERLRKREETGASLWGIPYDKIKVWANLPLRDGRIKDFKDKKVTKTFRLRPQILTRLKNLAKEWGCTETEALEKALTTKSFHLRR
jgi:hypothetical protein